MGKAKCDIRIGTSGWHYSHWEELYYPPGLAKSKWFGHYARDFNTVEINNTFYQLPKEQTFKTWQQQAPKGFLYTVKANRYITHIKRLKDAKEPIKTFFGRAELLKEHFGPVLYQLPPNYHKHLDRLRDFLRVLPKKRDAIFEFRHKSWFSEDTYDLLNEFGAGFCVHDMESVPTPRIITSGLIYVRFHGATGRYEGNYPKSALQRWAQWIAEHIKEVRSVYAYFNNDIHGYAIYNALTLKEQLPS